MKIIITGGNGFLGNRLATRLLNDGVAWQGEMKPVSELILIDIAPPYGGGAAKDPRVTTLVGELVDRIRIPGALQGIDAVVHLAAVVSGQAEADFELGMRVNLDATRTVLDACRLAGAAPKLIFASSVAVFGGELPDIVRDDTTPTPKNSYGTQKFIGEQLVADYTRRGFIRGRAIRLPTIVVRPGKPNQAASSFASSIIREPSAGMEAICPVAPETRLWLLSPDGAVDALYRALIAEQVAWDEHTGRTALNIPGISVTVAEMVESLRRHAGEQAVRHIRWQRDPKIETIVTSWPGRFETARANALGFSADADFDHIVRSHLEQSGK
jgi:nucleoside-diphosphate-sugar epimerase